MSNAEINARALEIAMASRALRIHEKELKDILFWSGNADTYYEMQAERKRMMEERQAEEKRVEEQKQKDREAKARAMMGTLWIMGSLCIVIPMCTILFQLITVKHL
jgi:superfamily II DNA or RNA helicase